MWSNLRAIISALLELYILAVLTTAKDTSQNVLANTAANEPWTAKYGPQVDLPFSGPLSYSHLPQTECLEGPSQKFDIAILGFPFDTLVSYRTGARFGPYAIRSGSRRLRVSEGYTLSWGMNPYMQDSVIIDCGDIPITPFDNHVALDQMEVAYTTLLNRPISHSNPQQDDIMAKLITLAKDGEAHPRIVSLGGDHSIVLPILRSLYKVYGPITVIHFDAHLDTWSAIGYPGTQGAQGEVNHGTFFWKAGKEGLLTNSSVHAGIRCKMADIGDVEHDVSMGFELYSTDDIDDLGAPTIIKKIRERVGDGAIYLSLDIDVIDPGLAPATGTPEAAGWTTREVKRLLRGLAGLNVVGADVVEVAPAYDHAEITAIAAADIVHDFISLMTVSNQKIGTKKLGVKHGKAEL